jgi:hypothetical protein
MGIVKLSNTGFKSTTYTKYDSFLAGNTAFSPNSYESIATVSVGAGNTQATLSFTSIPSTYKHLQIRLVSILSANESPQIFFNNDTTSTNYNNHVLRGSGSSAAANYYNAAYIYELNNSISLGVFDILDYTDTNKNTTVRGLAGYDNNGSGSIYLQSNLWRNTAAVTRIDLTCSGVKTWNGYTQAALYGIKGV